MRKISVFILISFLLIFCKNENVDELNVENNDIDKSDAIVELVDTTLSQKKNKKELDTLELKLIEAGLVNIQTVNQTIIVDLKYAGADNFMGFNMYGNLENAYLQPEVAERLSIAQKYLIERHPNLSLYVFDAVRPISVQKMMWDALDSIPVNERVKFVSNPKNGSIHNYGAAVDVSIFDKEKDTLLDMGAGYDDLRKIAYPKHEVDFLASGELTEEQFQNRKLLRTVMHQGGFWVIPSEWWHFNAFSRDKAKELFSPID